MKRILSISILVVAAASLTFVFAAETPSEQDLRDKAVKLQKAGNYKEAYEIFAKLSKNPSTDAGKVPDDLSRAVSCLRQLGRRSELDAFREETIKAHAGNWRLLWRAARTYANGTHWGYIVSGEFHRGQRRGGGKYVSSYERDRVRALQLMQQAIANLKGEGDRKAVARFYLDLANFLMGNRGYAGAWRLQYLTDLSKLPDYEKGYYYGYGSGRGAPVGKDGKPVYHTQPKNFSAAKTDGERWRWCLLAAMEYDSARQSEVQLLFADFLRHQFGVQTMRSYGYFFGRGAEVDQDKKDTSGTWELHTLKETETIAKLASGVRRFTIPDEFNFIRIYQQVAQGKGSYAGTALTRLSLIFEDRRQYPKAAKTWRENIERFGSPEWKKKRLEQIVGNWGQFESILTQPAGRGATVQFRFRNGEKLNLTAHKIKIEPLLEDIKKYIKSNPRNFKWWQRNLGNVGYRLVRENQLKYVGKQLAAWEMDLKPRPRHFDRRVTVATPLTKAGAYMLTAKMAGGNTSRIVVWVADTAIVKKPVDGKTWWFVADAVTGKPIAKANVEFFGYWRQWKRDARYVTHTKNFSEFTDKNGQVMLASDRQPNNYAWLAIARTDAGRLAYLGFSGVWNNRRHDSDYSRTKAFFMTDRPVYRPKQKVGFKFWINHAKYDLEGKSAFAGKSFTVRINNPKGEKVYEKSLKVDEFGGASSELVLKKDATLGVYRISIVNNPGNFTGNGHFRVEEYKKPEFQVTVEAPKEPVKLGEKITATIKASYYFGGDVTHAKVKYKILRKTHSAQWYPIWRWDWLYGRGYSWFAYDYTWYPGWNRWGCKRPIPWWWHWWPREQPELVAEAQVPIGADGTVSVEIDTSLAKAIYGDRDHKYEITAEVTDRSRRTIVGTGSVLVARRAFKVYAWVNRGHYRVGDVVHTNFQARRIDGKGVKGSGVLRLMKISYKEGKPVETEAAKWKLDTDEDGLAQKQIKASEPGQYRLSYRVTDAKKHEIEGGYVLVVWGEGSDGSEFRFNDIELTPDRQDYKSGEKVNLRISTNRTGSTVLLFVRPSNGVYLPPKFLRLAGKSVAEQIEVVKKDMPNFFVEAMTIRDGKVFQEVRQITVPPQKRVMNVTITPTKKEFKPGEKAKVKIQLREANGEPIRGAVTITIYDKAVEYISGGSNVAKIYEFFWKWKRRHNPNTEHSLKRGSGNLLKKKEIPMSYLGAFGYSVADEMTALDEAEDGMTDSKLQSSLEKIGGASSGSPRKSRRGGFFGEKTKISSDKGYKKDGGGAAPTVEPAVRTKFADTALWVANIVTDESGQAEVELDMPENLTTWKTMVWAMGSGTRVGEGSVELVTTKDLIIRLQAPRFFVQKDEVVLSAVVHNYLKTKKKVKVVLELGGGCLELLEGVKRAQTVRIDANGEARVDWRVKVIAEGSARITMKALTDEESDAMAMEFPVYVHGMLKTESFSGALRPADKSGRIVIRVPKERRPDQSRLEVRYSPTLAMSMVDALPYTIGYPYGCTEQTLNRFLPTVITQKVLQRMGVDLAAVREKRTNLNAQEIGDDVKRAHDWKRLIGAKRWDGNKWVPRNPVFDRAEVGRMVKAGLDRLTSMQCSDGGWGWFSGWGERSYPHTTAVVVHGLQIARANDVAVVPAVLQRGIDWLRRYQKRQLIKLRNGRKRNPPIPWKKRADNLDALVYMVLVDEKLDSEEMRSFLYEDRNHISVYAKAMFGLACHKVGDTEKRDMLIRNVEQYLVSDDENQTAFLKLPNSGWWWRWYGSEIEAHAYYLKLLAATDPKGQKASRIVKYLLNNRRHATYWNSTRDTAYAIEALADFIKASGEDRPDLTVQLFLDGKKVKEVKIDKENLFSFDNKFVLTGREVTDGEHTIELRKKGSGPLYYNAYLTNFTLEDPIAHAGLEIKVRRKYYRLLRVDKTVKAEGSRGQAVDRKVEKYERKELANLDTVKSGDLVEIELTIESKNDYEYIMFEDMKAAGFEPVKVRSGYSANGLGAYMELRDERVTFFVRRLARGKHSIAYRMRAEIPGKFSALPTRASAMYAPELKANSDEIKLKIVD